MRLDRIWLVVPLLLLLQLHLAAAAYSPDQKPDVSTSQTPPRSGYGTFDCAGIAWADCDDALRPVLKAVYECEPGYGFLAWPDKSYHAKDEAKGLCLPCGPGFYSPGGYATCRPCGSSNGGFTTPNGASKAEQCFCKPGFGGVGCTQCPKGMYSLGGTSQDPRASCLPCPPNNNLKNAMHGAVSPHQCGGCLPGFGGPTCQPCPANTFSEGGDCEHCKPCGQHQSSPPMSRSRGYCTCVAGYGYNADLDECILCSLGSFWPGPASYDTHVQVMPLATGPSACIRCANNPADELATTTLAEGSTSREQCFCNPGYGGPNCSPCHPGTYSPGGTSQDPQASCLSCPLNSQLDRARPGAVSSQQCGGCLPGFGGPTCQPCPANTFSEGGDCEHCKPCGPHQSSPPMSRSRHYCDCVAGYGYNAYFDECILCPLGFFWPGPASIDTYTYMHAARDPSACIQCVNNPEDEDATTTLAVGSTSGEHCVCRPGYGGPNCQKCSAGSWSSGGSLEPCTICSNGAIAPPGSTCPTACGCEPGRGGPSCSVCPKDSYGLGGLCADGTNEECTHCPPNQMTLNTGAKSEAECVCKPGFAGLLCKECIEGQICPGGSKDPPTRCPANSEAPLCNESFTPRDCQCKPGFGRPAGSSAECEDCPLCVECPAGFWNNQGRETCKACPPGQFSLPGSKLDTECQNCTAGSYVDEGVCVVCPFGSWTADDGAVGKESCNRCIPGFGLQPCPGTTHGSCLSCQPCPAGTYQSGEAAVPCTPCPEGTTSYPGSRDAAQCLCKPGYGLSDVVLSDSDLCQLCPIGSFSPLGNNWSISLPCIQCHANMVTLQPGSTSSTDCVCRVGYGSTADAPTTCSACEFPAYQGHLDENQMPVTSATKENPYPRCQLCNTGDGSHAVVGDEIKKCLTDGETAGAYCVNKEVPFGSTSMFTVPACL